MTEHLGKFRKTINNTFFGFGGILLALNTMIFPNTMRYLGMSGQPLTPPANVIAAADDENADEAEKTPAPKKIIYVIVTAYSSTPDQCDDTPFTTASGTRVHDGVIAANFLRFGTKVRFPDFAGDKKFTVEDRMHPRFSDRADIWFPTREEAINFGVRRLQMEIY